MKRRRLDRWVVCLVGVCVAVGLSSCVPGPAATGMAANSTAPDPTAETEGGKKVKVEKVMFGAGCFWGVEAAFRKVKGVTATAVGYSGGTVENPTYKQVCSGRTGHAEVVELAYDPSEVTFEELLDVFWSIHDPTTLNRQGPDFGSQYRSAIFFTTAAQKAAAEASKERLQKSGKWKQPVVTEITAASTFWRAEEYHQCYLEKSGKASCGPH